jgi:MFS family permease
MGDPALNEPSIHRYSAAQPTPRLSRGGFAAVLAGNALEFYDFLSFAFFAPQISRTFFPGSGDRLLLTLATFGAGFLTRPIGGIILGRLADRRGRKPALQISFSLMGIAIVGLALTPGYATIGAAAPLLILLFRLMQGFALGGDVGAATAYLVEAAPPHRRGLFVALQYASQDAARIVAGLVGMILAALLTTSQLDAWGWRVAFLLGACIVPFGLVLRSRLEETLPQEAAPHERAAGFRPYVRIAILGLLLLGSGTIMTYTTDYLSTYAQETLLMPVSIAFGTTAVSGLCALGFALISGWLSDRFGRKPVILVPLVLLFFMTVPIFLLLSHFRTTATLLTTGIALSMLVELSSGPVLISVTEALPAHLRAGALALIYAVAISVFGGSTQFVIAWLIDVTGSPLAPAWYMTGAIGVGLIGLLFLPETAPRARAAKPAKPAAAMMAAA